MEWVGMQSRESGKCIGLMVRLLGVGWYQAGTGLLDPTSVNFVLHVLAVQQGGARSRSGSLEQASWPGVEDGMEGPRLRL